MGGLQKIRGGTESKCLGGQFRIGIHGEENQLRVRKQAFDLPARVKPIQQGHAYIYDHDIRLELHCGLQQCATVADAAYDFILRLQQLLEACATYFVIVGQKNAYSTHNCSWVKVLLTLSAISSGATVASTGTRAITLVPPFGFDSIAKTPLTRWTRSCILMSPRPLPRFAASTSNPAPSSLTSSPISLWAPSKRTMNSLFPLCLTALCSASWAMRKRQRETSRGSWVGTLSCVNLILTDCCSPYSSQNVRRPATMPRYSSLEE